jgi:hypothetical protein
MILIFKYNNKILKFFPKDENLNLVEYANTNLPNNIPYKIISSIENLTDEDLVDLLNTPDGLSTNNIF